MQRGRANEKPAAKRARATRSLSEPMVVPPRHEGALRPLGELRRMIDRRAHSVRSRPILTREHQIHCRVAQRRRGGGFRPHHCPTLDRASTRRAAVIAAIAIRFLRFRSAASARHFADFIRHKITRESEQREKRCQHQEALMTEERHSNAKRTTHSLFCQSARRLTKMEQSESGIRKIPPRYALGHAVHSSTSSSR